MAGPIHLTSLTNPRVKAVVRLRQGRYRRRTGWFVAEGCRQIDRALVAQLRMLELFWCPSLLGDRGAVVAQLGRRGGERFSAPGLFTVGPAVFDRMSYRRNPEGVLAVFEQRHWELEAALSSVADSPGDDAALWLVAVGIEKPGNLGAMARSVAAAGGSGVLVADAVVDPMHPNALDASTGAVLALPIVAADTETIITALHGRRISIIAATPPPEAPPEAPRGVSLVVDPGRSAAMTRWL